LDYLWDILFVGALCSRREFCAVFVFLFHLWIPGHLCLLFVVVFTSFAKYGVGDQLLLKFLSLVFLPLLVVYFICSSRAQTERQVRLLLTFVIKVGGALVRAF
jgi:hypothetical protein